MDREATRTFDLTRLLTGHNYGIGCAESVCEAAQARPGVLGAWCDLESGTLQVRYDPSALRVREVDDIVTRLSFEAAGRVARAAYSVTGLD